MKRLVIPLLALALTGCAGFQQGIQDAGQTLCDNESAARAALHLALLSATTIRDDAAREASIAAIQVSITALDECPEPL